MCDNRLAEVDGTVDDRLFLFPFQNSRNDGLGGDAESPVVNDHCSQGVETLQVDGVVNFHTLKNV